MGKTVALTAILIFTAAPGSANSLKRGTDIRAGAGLLGRHLSEPLNGGGAGRRDGTSHWYQHGWGPWGSPGWGYWDWPGRASGWAHY